MNENIKKIVLYVSFILICLMIFVGSLHSLIDVKDIKKVTITSIERAFPNISIDFSELEYSLSTSLKLFGKDLVIKLKKRQSEGDIETLCKLKSFELKIPLLSLIFNGGRLRLTGHFPEFNFEKYKKGNNWRQALIEQKLYKELEVLSFIANSRLNFIFYHTKLNYKLKTENFKSIELEKVVIKDLNSSTTTAYEISSDINYSLEDDESIKTNVLAIGQVNLKKYLSESVLESFLVTKFTNLKYSGYPQVIPLLQNSINLTLYKNGDSDFFVDTKIGEILDFQTNASFGSGNLKLSNTQLIASLKNIVEILGDKLKKKLSYLDFENSKLIIEGEATYNKADDVFSPKFTFKTDREFGLGLPYSISFNNTLSGKMEDSSVYFNLISNIFDGTVVTDLSTNFNYYYKQNKSSFFDSYKAKISATSIKLEKVNFRDIFYSASNEEEVVYSGSRTKKKMLRTRYPYLQGEIDLDLRQMFINENKISLNGKLFVNPYSIVSKEIDFNIGNGTGKLSYYLHRDEDNIKTTKIDSTFVNTPLSAINLFLPDYFKNYTGIMSGDLGTQIVRDYENEIANSYASITVRDGKFDAIDIDKYVTKFLEENNFFKKKNSQELVDIINELNFDGNFSELKLQAEMENGIAQIKSLKLKDLNERFELAGKGVLYLKDRSQKSELEVSAKYKNSKVSSYLKRIIGTSQFPLLLMGEGLELLPLPNFTIEKLLSSSMKGRATKFIDSAKFKKMLKDNNIIINPKLLKGLK